MSFRASAITLQVVCNASEAQWFWCTLDSVSANHEKQHLSRFLSDGLLGRALSRYWQNGCWHLWGEQQAMQVSLPWGGRPGSQRQLLTGSRWFQMLQAVEPCRIMPAVPDWLTQGWHEAYTVKCKLAPVLAHAHSAACMWCTQSAMASIYDSIWRYNNMCRNWKSWFCFVCLVV